MAKQTNGPVSLSAEHILLRITFSGIIIATFFAVISENTQIGHIIGRTSADVVVWVVGVSAMLSFLYLLGVASALKYRNPRRVDRFIMSYKVIAFFYDYSINIFGLALILWPTEYLIRHLIGSSWSVSLIPLFLGLFGIIYFGMRLIWAFLRRFIEYYYDIRENIE